jgi:hypothetical protein
MKPALQFLSLVDNDAQKIFDDFIISKPVKVKKEKIIKIKDLKEKPIKIKVEKVKKEPIVKHDALIQLELNKKMKYKESVLSEIDKLINDINNSINKLSEIEFDYIDINTIDNWVNTVNYYK